MNMLGISSSVHFTHIHCTQVLCQYRLYRADHAYIMYLMLQRQLSHLNGRSSLHKVTTTVTVDTQQREVGRHSTDSLNTKMIILCCNSWRLNIKYFMSVAAAHSSQLEEMGGGGEDLIADCPFWILLSPQCCLKSTSTHAHNPVIFENQFHVCVTFLLRIKYWCPDVWSTFHGRFVMCTLKFTLLYKKKYYNRSKLDSGM
jgi:hypothetical protein